jgi:hypothetical protein
VQEHVSQEISRLVYFYLCSRRRKREEQVEKDMKKCSDSSLSSHFAMRLANYKDGRQLMREV